MFGIIFVLSYFFENKTGIIDNNQKKIKHLKIQICDKQTSFQSTSNYYYYSKKSYTLQNNLLFAKIILCINFA